MFFIKIILRGGRPQINKHKLFVLITYAYAFRHISLREMESFCKFDLRAINIMDGEIPSVYDDMLGFKYQKTI